MIVLISMIFGNLIYFPKDLNYVLELFTKKAKTFDYDELRYRISCNNSLCTAILSDPKVSRKEVDIIKIKHEIEYLRDCRDKLEIHFSKEICRINYVSDDEDSKKRIDIDTKNELLKQHLQLFAELKREKFGRKIRILEKAFIDLEYEDVNSNENVSNVAAIASNSTNGFNSSDSVLLGREKALEYEDANSNKNGDIITAVVRNSLGDNGFSSFDWISEETDENVVISIIDTEINHDAEEELGKAIDHYMSILGYVMRKVLKTERGSLFKEIRYRISRFLTPEVRENLYEEGKNFVTNGRASIEAQLEKPGVESTKQIVEATASLLKAVEKFDNIAMRLGKLIVVKLTDENGKSQVFVETISLSLQHQLEANPKILRNPQAVADFLQLRDEQPPPLL
jgi:hypothetical protein